MKKRVWKRNPLSYLGFLGFIGFVGLWSFSMSLLVFFLFFFFFTYTKMTPDELFWQNVRRAGLRALTVYLVLQCAHTLAMNIWGIVYYFTSGGWSYPVAEGGMVTVEEGLFTRYVLNGSVSVLLFIITICTFVLTLLYFDRKERKNAEPHEDGGEEAPC